MNYLPIIKKLSLELNLKFNPKDYSYKKITPRQYLLGIFLGGCSDPDYIKIGGKTKIERAKNIEKFTKSDLYKKQLKGRGGTVLTIKEIIKQKSNIKYIQNKKIKNELINYNNKLEKTIKRKYLVIIIDNQSLIHEFIHILLNVNRLDFSRVRNNWGINEGLVTYLEYYIQNKRLLPPKDSMNKIYYDNAIKWKELLKKAKTPQEKNKIIKKEFKNLIQ